MKGCGQKSYVFCFFFKMLHISIIVAIGFLGIIGKESITNAVRAYTHNLDMVDVYTNSYGLATDKDFRTMDQYVVDAIKKGIQEVCYR